MLLLLEDSIGAVRRDVADMKSEISAMKSDISTVKSKDSDTDKRCRQLEEKTFT